MKRYQIIQDGNIYSELTNIVDFDLEVTDILINNNVLKTYTVKTLPLKSLVTILENELDMEVIIKEVK